MTERMLSESRNKLLDSALYVIRAQGYSGTTVDDICKRAGVTKGSFFHHFKSKDELALSAVEYFSNMADQIFSNASYRRLPDPLQRILGYLDLRSEMLGGELPEYTCLLGTLVQEVYDSHPEIRVACEKGMSLHVDGLAKDLEAAKKLYAPKASWTAESVGYLIQSVLQGAFIFAKAKHNPDVAKESLSHLKRYISLIFNQTTNYQTISKEKL